MNKTCFTMYGIQFFRRRISFVIPSLLATLTFKQQESNVVAVDPSNDMYCGSSWIDAFQNCHEPCPGGNDSECGQGGWSCYSYTGCASKSESANDSDSNFTDSSITEQSDGDHDPTANNYCGTKWLDAMLTCSTPCPRGTIDCDNGQECFAATNCDRALEPLKSEMIMSLLGAQGKMTGDETGVLEASISSFLEQALEENKINVRKAGVTDQKAYNGRRVRGRWLTEQYRMEKGGRRTKFSRLYTVVNERETNDYEIEFNYTLRRGYDSARYSFENTTKRSKRRYLPTSSSALDVSMVITGEYRPPPYLDMDVIVEDSINRASADVVGDLRERGQRAGSSYFERVEDLRATSKGTATNRPTSMPTGSPTLEPSNSPTPAPSIPPTRSFEQSIQTGFGPDLYSRISRSYGIVFDIKTTPQSPTVAIEGLDIYSSSTSNVTYEIWTKEGSWQGYEGKLEEFTKIAEGEVESAGECTEEYLVANSGECIFTSIPFDNFQAVPILGGGATRSFYITLQSKEIVYSIGNSTEGSAEMTVWSGSPELEIYEGAGVLMYPFDAATDLLLHYRKPRGFLGVVHYNRMPCPGEVVAEDGMYTWPCESRAPVSSLELGTGNPSVEPTTLDTAKPSGVPPIDESASNVNSDEGKSPSLNEDIMTDVNEDTDTEYSKNGFALNFNNATTVGYYSDYRTNDLVTSNIVITLQTVPDKIMNNREILKYQEVLLKFLRSQDSLAEVKMDVVSALVWHQSKMGEEKEDTLTSTSGGKIKSHNTASTSENKIRAKTRRMKENIHEFTYITPSEGDSLRVDIEVTTIIQSSKSTLPPSTASKLLVFALKSSNSSFIDDLHAQRLFYSYFKDIDGVSSRLIDRVTAPPTMVPTTYLHLVSINDNGVLVEDEEPSSPLGIFAVTAICIGALWCILTVLTACYIGKARRDMTNDKLLHITKKNETPSRIDLEEGDQNEQGIVSSPPNSDPHQIMVSTDKSRSSITIVETTDYAFKKLDKSTQNHDIRSQMNDIKENIKTNKKLGTVTNAGFSSIAKTSGRRGSGNAIKIRKATTESKLELKRKSAGDISLLSGHRTILDKHSSVDEINSFAHKNNVADEDKTQICEAKNIKTGIHPRTSCACVVSSCSDSSGADLSLVNQTRRRILSSEDPNQVFEGRFSIEASATRPPDCLSYVRNNRRSSENSIERRVPALETKMALKRKSDGDIRPLVNPNFLAGVEGAAGSQDKYTSTINASTRTPPTIEMNGKSRLIRGR